MCAHSTTSGKLMRTHNGYMHRYIHACRHLAIYMDACLHRMMSTLKDLRTNLGGYKLPKCGVAGPQPPSCFCTLHRSCHKCSVPMLSPSIGHVLAMPLYIGGTNTYQRKLCQILEVCIHVGLLLPFRTVISACTHHELIVTINTWVLP